MSIDKITKWKDPLELIVESLNANQKDQLLFMLRQDRFKKALEEEYPKNTGKLKKPVDWEELRLLMQKHGYKEIKSNNDAVIGDTYMYAKIWDNKLVGVGREERNYAGWDIATSRNKKRLSEVLDRLKRSYEDYLKTGTVTYESSLYEQIKDYEIADSYPEELGHYH